MQQTHQAGTGEQKAYVRKPDAVTLRLGRDLGGGRQRGSLDPLTDQDPRRARQYGRDGELRMAGESFRCTLLGCGLEGVVQLFAHPGCQLVDQRLDVHPAGERSEDLRHPPDLLEVAAQRIVGARVLDLDRHGSAVRPHRSMHLADGCRGRGQRLERGERGPPVGSEFPSQHGVDPRGGHRGGRILQSGELRPVRAGQVFGQGRLEQAQGLTELHRATLELPQHPEELLGGPLLHLLGDRVSGGAAQSFAEPDGGPTGEAERQGGQTSPPAESRPGQ